ncbi:MAG: hypothetical protein ACYC7D_11885 [Nitrososphaerales archaeon]
MQRGNVQLEGLQFPSSIRDQGTSVEILKTSVKDISKWADDNRLVQDRPWGIVSKAKSKNEDLFLALGFRKVTRARLVYRDGRVERKEEESTEPEIGEFHFRNDGMLELYSCSAKLRNLMIRSFVDAFGKESLDQLYLPKESMTKLIGEAIEVLSVSLTGLGNPFFSDATLSGADPVNSKTCKELIPSGDVKSFRAKYSLESGGDATDVMMVTIHNNCKLRFFAGQKVQAQSDIEEFVTRVNGLASLASAAERES